VLYNTVAWPRKGGIPLRSQRDAGGGQGAGRVDDVEMRAVNIPRSAGPKARRLRSGTMSMAELEKGDATLHLTSTSKSWAPIPTFPRPM